MEPLIFILMLVTAAFYAVMGYAKTATSEEPDWYKAGATLLLGVLVGAGLALANVPVTQESVAAMILSYTGLLYVLECGLKAIVRWWKVRHPTPAPATSE
jgi:uncharacterized membrane protein AbrB (regulator of aidB expression)